MVLSQQQNQVKAKSPFLLLVAIKGGSVRKAPSPIIVLAKMNLHRKIPILWRNRRRPVVDRPPAVSFPLNGTNR